MGPASEPVPTVRLPAQCASGCRTTALHACDCHPGPPLRVQRLGFRGSRAQQAVATAVAVGAPAAIGAGRDEEPARPRARAGARAALSEGRGCRRRLGAEVAVVRRLATASLTWPLVLVNGAGAGALQDYPTARRYEARRGRRAAVRPGGAPPRPPPPRSRRAAPGVPPRHRRAARKSAMDHAGMISLGASVQADGDHRQVSSSWPRPGERAALLCIAPRRGQRTLPRGRCGRRAAGGQGGVGRAAADAGRPGARAPGGARRQKRQANPRGDPG
jgi:hypothetical protein